MAHIGRTRSGSWQARVSLPPSHWITQPNGKIRKQVSRTDPLKRVVAAWASDVEADLRRGKWHDPRPANATTVADWRSRWESSRRPERSTREKYDGHWRLRIAPRWGSIPLSDLTRLAVQSWVWEMESAGVNPDTVISTTRHFATMIQGAVDEGLISTNPGRRLNLPTPPPMKDRWLTREEFAAILVEAPTDDDRTLIDFDCHLGLRWGELAALDVPEVRFQQSQVHVVQVLTRKDGIRPYTKGKAKRIVPIPDHLLGPLATLCGDRDEGPVFRAAEGGRLHGENWRRRVWTPALKRAGVRYTPPHSMRHTAASWLVMADVSLYKVQAILGHKDARTTQRYAHLAPDAHASVRSAWTGMHFLCISPDELDRHDPL